MSGEGIHNVFDPTEILADIDTIEAAIIVIDALIDTIEAVTSALPTLAETGGTVTTDGTEQNVYINATPLGVFNPICVKINCTNHTAGETIVIRTYYQITAGVPARILEDTQTFVGLISPELLKVDLDPNRFGVSVTIEKTAGANRAYPWEVFYEI